MPWTEIESSEVYRSKRPFEQRRMREDYFDTVVAADPQFSSFDPDTQTRIRSEFVGTESLADRVEGNIQEMGQLAGRVAGVASEKAAEGIAQIETALPRHPLPATPGMPQFPESVNLPQSAVPQMGAIVQQPVTPRPEPAVPFTYPGQDMPQYAKVDPSRLPQGGVTPEIAVAPVVSGIAGLTGMLAGLGRGGGFDPEYALKTMQEIENTVLPMILPKPGSQRMKTFEQASQAKPFEITKQYGDWVQQNALQGGADNATAAVHGAIAEILPYIVAGNVWRTANRAGRVKILEQVAKEGPTLGQQARRDPRIFAEELAKRATGEVTPEPTRQVAGPEPPKADKFAMENLPRSHAERVERFTQADLPAAREQLEISRQAGDERATLIKDVVDYLEGNFKTPEQIKAEAGLIPQPKEAPSAGGIPADEGEVYAAGDERVSGSREGGQDLERKAPEQPGRAAPQAPEPQEAPQKSALAKAWDDIEGLETMEGAWDRSTHHNYRDTFIEPLAKRLEKGWQTAQQLSTKTHQAGKDLNALAKAGAIQQLWDAEGNPHYAAPGAEKPDNLYTSDELDRMNVPEGTKVRATAIHPKTKERVKVPTDYHKAAGETESQIKQLESVRKRLETNSLTYSAQQEGVEAAVTKYLKEHAGKLEADGMRTPEAEQVAVDTLLTELKGERESLYEQVKKSKEKAARYKELREKHSPPEKVIKAYRVEGKTFKQQKDSLTEAVAEAIKAVPEEPKEESIRFEGLEGADFTIQNNKEALQEFQKGLKSYTATGGAKKIRKPNLKPRPQIGKKESVDKSNMRRFKGRKDWWTDGAMVVKGKLPTGKLDWNREPMEGSVIEELLTVENQIPAEIRYYHSKSAEYGEAVGKEQIVDLSDEIENTHVIFKAGKKRYGYNANKFNVIRNRHPKATYKIGTDNGILVAYVKGKPVGGLMPTEKGFGKQKDIPGIKVAAKKGFADTGGYAPKTPSGFASTGEYATNVNYVLDMPEITYLAKQLMKGRYPSVVRYLGKAVGRFYGVGSGLIRLRADLFTDEKQAAATLAHEIGHLVDYLPDKDLRRGNILGRIASLKRYMKHTLPERPGAAGELTPADRKRLYQQAKRLVNKEGAERWIDEVIRKELPIAPQDVLNIWNAVEQARLINPELYNYVAQLNTAQKKAIVKDAMKGQVPAELAQFAKVIEEKTGKKVKVELTEEEMKDLVRGKYADLINEELAKRNLFDRNIIMEELKSLTLSYKPFDPSADPKFTKYRFSPVELYADAISALINAPGLLKSHAPKFYEAFFNYLETKPELQKLYNEIQNDIHAGGIERKRTKRVYEMFQSGDEAYALQLEKQGRRLEGLAREFIDANYSIIKKIKQVGEANVPGGENPRYKIEEMVYSGSEAEWLVVENHANIKKPLERVGLSWDDFGFQLYLRRVAGERAEMANPQGWTPRLAKQKIDELRNIRNAQQNQAMDKALAEFKRINDYVIDKGEEAGRWGKELLDIMKKNEDYATFDVIKYIERRHGRGPAAKIYQQIGTLQEISNPATATLMKNIAIIKATNRQIAAESVTEFLQKHFPDEITAADKRWNGKFQEIKDTDDPRKGLIVFLKNGKAQGYYVDRWIAESFERNPAESYLISKLLAALAQPFRSIFTELNYGFWMFNIHRDFFRALATLPKAKIRTFLPHYVKAIKPALRSVYGIPDPVIAEMQKGNMLISVADIRGQVAEDKQIDRLLKMYHIKKQSWNNKLIRPFGAMFTYYTNIGRAIERMPKIATKTYLEKKFPDMPPEVVGHIVRVRGGSPDFLRRGKLYPIYNNLLLFSNAMKEGYRGDYEAMAQRPAEFWWKRAKYVYLPKLLQFAAKIGLLGVGVKAIMDGVSEYDGANYHIIPLGTTESGKSVYLRVPVDESGRLLGGILWKILNKEFSKLPADLADYMAGQAPTLHPMLEILWASVQYASGQNPYDHFRGRYAIPEQIFKAGGARSHKAFAKWVANRMGATAVYKFKYDDIERIQTTLEDVLGYPFASNILGRFIKVSDYGVREKVREMKFDIRKERASEILDTKDALIKMVNQEQLKPKEWLLILKNADLVDRNLAVFFSRRWGNIFFEEWLTATSKEEKAAVLQKYYERNELLRKAQE